MESDVRSELDRVRGELLALQRAVRALILGSPDPAVTQQRVAMHLQQLQAQALPRALPEATIDGMLACTKLVLPRRTDEPQSR